MTRIALLVLALETLGPPAACSWAQGPGAPRAGARTYDARTVETLAGEVVDVERVPPAQGRAGGVHVVLKTDRESIPVHLGPAWYVDREEVQLRRGDHVQVEGSRVTFEGKPAIIAREVKKDGRTLTLRDAAGVPAWAGRGAGRK